MRWFGQLSMSRLTWKILSMRKQVIVSWNLWSAIPMQIMWCRRSVIYKFQFYIFYIVIASLIFAVSIWHFSWSISDLFFPLSCLSYFFCFVRLYFAPAKICRSMDSLTFIPHSSRVAFLLLILCSYLSMTGYRCERWEATRSNHEIRQGKYRTVTEIHVRQAHHRASWKNHKWEILIFLFRMCCQDEKKRRE